MRLRTATLSLSLVFALSAACDRSPSAPSSQAPPGSSTTSPAVEPFHISGIVTDESGQLLQNVEVLVNHYDHLGSDGRPGYPVRVTRARTDGSGRYEMDIQALRNAYASHGRDVVGMGVAIGGVRYLENDVQFVGSSTSIIVKNFQIDRFVNLALGNAATVTFRPDATLCVEWINSYGPLCRFVSVAVPADGTLTISAVPLSGAGEIFVGLLNPLDEPAPPAPGFTGWSTVSYPVKGGTLQTAALRISSGFLAPQSFLVTATLQ